MKTVTKIGLTSAALIIIAGSIAPSAHAFWPFDNLTSNQPITSTTTPPTLLETLIQKLGLNKDQVNTIVNQYRTDRQAEQEIQYEAQLTEAVKAGKLTDTQAQLLIAKHKELQQQNETERQARYQRYQDLQKWADDNNIDISYLTPGHGMMDEGWGGIRRGGMGRGMGMWGN
jgi:hypothetical protein